MTTCEILVAALLLTGPADPPPELAAILRPSVLALALDAEVMDPRERGFVMGQDVLGDLAMLQGRYVALSGCPALWEADRFPDAAHVRRALELNRARRNHLAERRKIDLVHAGEFEAEIRRVDQIYQVFDAVHDSTRRPPVLTRFLYSIQSRQISPRIAPDSSDSPSPRISCPGASGSSAGQRMPSR